MKSKVVLIVVAVVLGGIAAFGMYRYLAGVQLQAEAGSVMTDVLVATQDVPRGADANTLLSSGLVETTKVPQRYVPKGAVSSLRALTDMVLAVPVTKGEVITSARFQYPSEAGLAFAVPADFVAVTVPVNESRGLAQLLKAGDRVAVLGTLPGKSSGSERTRIVLGGVRVLAVNRNTGAGAADEQSSSGLGSSGQTSGQDTVTLAVSPADAEKVVFVAETGGVWLALLSTTASSAERGPGQTAASVME
jgi:pilus assembly protein CpaB